MIKGNNVTARLSEANKFIISKTPGAIKYYSSPDYIYEQFVCNFRFVELRKQEQHFSMID